MKPWNKKTRMLSALLLGTALMLLTGAPLLLGAAFCYAVTAAPKVISALPPGVCADITIDVSTLLEEWQEYYLNAGQNEDEIQVAVQDKRDYTNFSKLMVVDGEIVKLSEAEITDVIQGFKKEFSPKGDATVTPVPFQLRNIKIDLSIYPDDIKSTYYGFWKGLKSDGDREQWPVVRWIWEKLVAPKWGANLAHIDWCGKYVAPTSNTTPGPTKGSYTGLKQIIIDDLDSGTPKMTEITLTNSLTNTSQIFDAFEEAYDALDQKYHDEAMVILCSPKTQLNYFRDRRNTTGTNMDYAINGKDKARDMTLDGRENVRIQPMNGIGRSGDHDWLVITTERNLLRGERSNGYNLRMESDKRAVAIMADWWEGVGFGLAEEVFVVRGNDDSSN